VCLCPRDLGGKEKRGISAMPSANEKIETKLRGNARFPSKGAYLFWLFCDVCKGGVVQGGKGGKKRAIRKGGKEIIKKETPKKLRSKAPQWKLSIPG